MALTYQTNKRLRDGQGEMLSFFSPQAQERWMGEIAAFWLAQRVVKAVLQVTWAGGWARWDRK